MTVQDKVWLLTLVGLGGVTLAFLYVISQATRQADSTRVQAQSYAIRRWFFLALVASGLAAAVATLLPFPIPDQHAPSGAVQIIKVTGHQWAADFWAISSPSIQHDDGARPAAKLVQRIKAKVDLLRVQCNAICDHAFQIEQSAPRKLHQRDQFAAQVVGDANDLRLPVDERLVARHGER